MELSANPAGFSATRLARITEHFQRRYIDEGKIAGCQIAVARRGQLAYFESLGNMDRERNAPMRDDAIFRIYSMTKPITAVALMTLYERGHFQLNDPVSRLLPEWRDLRVYTGAENGASETAALRTPITFRHVLSHSGGLSYGGGPHPVDKAYRDAGIGVRAGETLRGLCDKLGRVPLRYQPGERWLYSYSSDVCAYLVEALSGKRFDEYLQEAILDPLGMKDTAFFVPAHKRDRFTANYRRAADRSLELIDDPQRSPYLEQPSFLAGGHGLTSTTADYLRFCEMLRRGGELDGERVLGPRTLQLMTKNHLKGGGTLTQLAIGAFSETANEGVGFGLGFATTVNAVDAGMLGEGDYYWGGAASTIFWVDPREDLIAVLMTQLMPSSTFNFRGQLKSLIYSAIID
jgi:CubicO group peptidase (beta-lactamase class C family)